MPRFSYRSYDRTGRLQQGDTEAETRQAALAGLAERGHFVLDISQGLSADAKPWWQRDLSEGRPLPLTGVATLARELATLTRADVPIDECLRLIAAQPQIGRRTRVYVTAVLERVLAGAALSEALTVEPRAVPEYFWRLVKAGEISGSLPKVLDDLAQLTETQARLRTQIISTLLYPAVLLVAAIVAIAVIVAVMVPAILPLFEGSAVKPPLLLSALAGIERGIAGAWPLLILILLALAVGAFAIGRHAGAAVSRDRLLLRLPLVGGLIQRRNTARFARTLATLARNGVPLLEALRVSSDLLSNRAWRSAMQGVEAEVNEGGSLAGPLARSSLLPELALRLIAIGEKTGQLDAMLARVGDIYEHDLQVRVQRMLDLAGHLLTLLIGGIIGGLVLSVMSAILSVNELATR